MNTTPRRGRRATLAAVVSASALLTLLTTGTSAVAATARRPDPRPVPRPVPAPTVRLESAWRFDVGGQVDRTTAAQTWYGDTAVFHDEVPVELVWHADRAGRPARDLRYDLYQTTFRTTQVLDDSTATSYATLHSDLAHPIAPHPGPLAMILNPTFRLEARDAAGRTTTVQTQRHPVFSEQQDGTTYLDGRSVFPGAPVAGRRWTTRTGPDYDAGSVLATSVRGAAVRIPVHTRAGQWVALEMTTGPALGAVEVRVDGHRVGVVDTRAATTRPRVLVAEYRMTAGDHTVTLVNLGLRHRPTVELDGVFASD